MFEKNIGLYFQADPNGGAGGAGDDGGGGETLTYEKFIAEQPENVKALIEGNTKNLKSALDAERESRKSMEKDLRDLAKKAEDGSEAQKNLTAMADKLADADRKASFYEAAHVAGVTNLKLALAIAIQDDLFDKKGSVNFGEMKSSYPELFGKKKLPDGNAGDGNDNVEKPANMNERIRRAAGR